MPGLTLDNTTGAIIPGTSTAGTYTVTYTVAASGGCPGATATTSVTIYAIITPTFTPVAAICSGATLNCIANNIKQWYHRNLGTGTEQYSQRLYTFTPTAGQCATTATLTITVNPNVTPTFNSVAAIVPVISLAPLPTTSLEWYYRNLGTGFE